MEISFSVSLFVISDSLGRVSRRGYCVPTSFKSLTLIPREQNIFSKLIHVLVSELCPYGTIVSFAVTFYRADAPNGAKMSIGLGRVSDIGFVEFHRRRNIVP
jgi:hypothetical protein